VAVISCIKSTAAILASASRLANDVFLLCVVSVENVEVKGLINVLNFSAMDLLEVPYLHRAWLSETGILDSWWIGFK
jgi:hypothetical protein